MATAYLFACCGHSNLVIFNRISAIFHIKIASSKFSPKFKYECCPTNNNQDGLQNGRYLPVCTCGHTALVIYYPVASKFQRWIAFIKLSPKLEYEFCLIT